MLIEQSRNAAGHCERCFAVAVLESLLDVERKKCMRHPKSALLNHLPIQSGYRWERAGKLDVPRSRRRPRVRVRSLRPRLWVCAVVLGLDE